MTKLPKTTMQLENILRKEQMKLYVLSKIHYPVVWRDASQICAKCYHNNQPEKYPCKTVRVITGKESFI